MMTLKPEQWDNLMSKSEQLQDKILEEVSILEKIEDPCSTEFDSQLNIVRHKMEMLINLNAAIKMGLSIQLKPEHTGDSDGDHQLTIENTEE